jgi:hypothetical protein
MEGKRPATSADPGASGGAAAAAAEPEIGNEHFPKAAIGFAFGGCLDLGRKASGV